MVVTFTAHSAGFVGDSSDEVLEVGFSEAADGSGRSILINRSTDAEALKAPYGMDSYCVSNELGNSDYGGLVQVRFEAGKVELTFSAESAAILGSDSIINIILAVPGDIQERVRKGLREVLTWGRSGAVPQLIGL